MTWKQPLFVGLVSEYHSFKQKDLWRRKVDLYIQPSKKIYPISPHLPHKEQNIFSVIICKKKTANALSCRTKAGMKQELWHIIQRMKFTCWTSNTSLILKSTNITTVEWQRGESHSDGQSLCLVWIATTD